MNPNPAEPIGWLPISLEVLRVLGATMAIIRSGAKEAQAGNMNEINFSFGDRQAKPTDELHDSYSHDGIQDAHPPQDVDGEEYICGSTGNAHPYANSGRDQDRSRQDEYIPAQGCARYVS